jgi:quinoprotein dehydrogenase-associated probable ABC transporter substrate-binding protein
MSRPCRRIPGRSTCAMFAAAWLAIPTAAPAQTAELVPTDELRVCADPANLPFSNEQGEGFENHIAQIVAEALGLPLRSVFFPRTQGFVRNTLGARRCDLVVGTVAGDDTMQNTTPYYHTSYVMAFRSAGEPPPEDLNDPRLRDLRIGVIARTPPVDLLARHGLLTRVRPYPLVVDTRYESPAAQMLRDLAKSEIDVALVWGPYAGYAIQAAALPLSLRALTGEPGSPRMDYRITMGVRANEPEWRRRINAAIRARQPDITAVLRHYGVPLLDNAGQLQPTSR